MANLADCFRKYCVNQYDYQYGFSKDFWFQILHNDNDILFRKKKIISNKYIHCITTHVHEAIMFISVILNGRLECVDK